MVDGSNSFTAILISSDNAVTASFNGHTTRWDFMVIESYLLQSDSFLVLFPSHPSSTFYKVKYNVLLYKKNLVTC